MRSRSTHKWVSDFKKVLKEHAENSIDVIAEGGHGQASATQGEVILVVPS